jgi:hypothetical protein
MSREGAKKITLEQKRKTFRHSLLLHDRCWQTKTETSSPEVNVLRRRLNAPSEDVRRRFNQKQ